LPRLKGTVVKCPQCHKKIRLIRNSEGRIETTLGYVTAAGSLALCTAPFVSLAVPAGLAPVVCAVSAAQDLLLGAVRKDAWKCSAGALGVLSAGFTVRAAAAEQASLARDAGLGPFGGAVASMRRWLDKAKKAVSARNTAKNAASHWVRIKGGANGLFEVLKTFGPPPRPNGCQPVREIELQTFSAPKSEIFELSRCTSNDNQTFDDDGWQVLPDNPSVVHRHEDLSRCMGWLSSEDDPQSEWVVCSEKAGHILQESAAASFTDRKDANCTALRA